MSKKSFFSFPFVRYHLMGIAFLLTTLTSLCASAADAYNKMQATVRATTDLSNEEKNFIQKRKAKVKNALEKLLNRRIDNDKVPNIALCFSGGGYRAMIETIGSLEAADTIGLLDSTCFMGSLSGSTWTLMPWIASGKPIEVYKNELAQKIRSFSVTDLSLSEIKSIFSALVKKGVTYGQSVNLVDVYGALLANILLEDITPNKQTFALPDLQAKIMTGNYPLPIATAVLGGSIENRPCFEFTPFEIGCRELTMFIPSWALGRTFSNGVSEQISPGLYSPTPSLGYYMGIWGSAFAVDFKTASERLLLMIEKMPTIIVKNTLSMFMSESRVQDAMDFIQDLRNTITNLSPEDIVVSEQTKKRIEGFSAGSAKLPNPAFGMKNEKALVVDYAFNKQVPLNTIPSIKLADGGYDFPDKINQVNLGIIPLLRPERNVDIIIICDSSRRLNGAPALQAAELRAKKLGLKFPLIDYTNINKTISVFIDENDNETPIIVYLPGIKNKGYSPTFDPETTAFTATQNFQYSPDQVKTLSGLTKFSLIESKDIIIDAINKAIERKSSP